MGDIIDRIIAREGGYVNHPLDRGNCTNMGITRRALGNWRWKPVTCNDIKNLKEREARAIYQARYIVDPGYDRIRDPGLREHVIDAGVLHGPGRATRWLQDVAGVKADGIFGPISARPVNRGYAEVVGRRFAAHRIRFLGRLITKDPSQAVFAAGWMNRATHFLD